ncbi:hypothetical protein [Actinomadura sp. 6N118]|uniref:hypothetical protein n=1 Tax=Actinomadura sp. 6N118 TaxID=3375151 RepID=UPI00378D546B
MPRRRNVEVEHTALDGTRTITVFRDGLARLVRPRDRPPERAALHRPYARRPTAHRSPRVPRHRPRLDLPSITAGGGRVAAGRRRRHFITLGASLTARRRAIGKRPVGGCPGGDAGL